MFFKKKTPVQTTQGAAPPWENIDTTSTKHASSSGIRFNLTEFVASVTGFGKWGTRFLLLGLAVALGFLAFAFYQTSTQGPPLPPRVDRPAMDQYATSTPLRSPTSIGQ